jgi:predicted ribosomally synthesized peptide with SipW-like signal peptide
LKVAVLGIIASLNWISLSVIGQTIAYLNDTETSTSNIFAASILDFELTSDSDFTPTPIKLGESTTRTIDILNYGNQHKYKVSAINFSGDICDYLILDANLNNGQVTYSGSLKDFIDFGPTVYTDPSSWFCTLTLPSDAPESVLGQTCLFDFVFFGSQTRNDLDFGNGFKDTEEITNNIKSLTCENIEIRSQGYWKNHSEDYILPQFLGSYPNDIEIITAEDAEAIFDNHSSLMPDILRIQLLAMKFNIAKFGLGDYYIQSEGKTINELVAYADQLLRDNEFTSEELAELERVKDILDDLNTAEYLNYCYELPAAPLLIMSSISNDDNNEEEFFNEEPMLMMTMLSGTPEGDDDPEEPAEELEEENNEEPEEQEKPEQTEENQEQTNEEPEENTNPEEEPQLSEPQGDIITENNNEDLPEEEPAILPQDPEEPQQTKENNNTQEENSGGGETTSEIITENNEVTE